MYPLSERSGLNLRGAFNLDNVTQFSANDEEDMDTSEVLGSVGPLSVPTLDVNVYRMFWNLQTYFNNPALSTEGQHWTTITGSVEAVLSLFESVGTLDVPSDSSQNDDPAELDDPFFEQTLADIRESYSAKLLTSRKLFRLQIQDTQFRRQFLVQLAILFHYLKHGPIVPAESRSATSLATTIKPLLSDVQEAWVTAMKQKSTALLERIPPAGKRLVACLQHVLLHDRHWISWKNESCPPFERPPVVLESKRRKIEVGRPKELPIWSIAHGMSRMRPMKECDAV